MSTGGGNSEMSDASGVSRCAGAEDWTGAWLGRHPPRESRKTLQPDTGRADTPSHLHMRGLASVVSPRHEAPSTLLSMKTQMQPPPLLPGSRGRGASSS